IPINLVNYSCSIDVERMDQVFSNLIFNAIKNTSIIDGKITIGVSLLKSERLMIKVVDNGVGIKNEDLPFIFDRFYKTDTSEKQGGTGLGLAIVKQIIESHKGEIWAESTENEGATFYIVLPIIVNEKQIEGG